MASKVEQLKRALAPTIIEAMDDDASPAILKVVPIDRAPAAQEKPIKEGDLTYIPLKQIVAKPQYRKTFDEEKIRQLADSVSVRGVLAPIIVRSEGDVFVIVAGERRYRAAKLAGIDTIPARIYQLTDNESAEITLTENVGREDLNPIELAHGFQDLMNRLGITGKELARRVGVDATTVTRTIRLLRLPDDIRRQIASGEVSSHVAREVARIPDETTQRHVLKKARRNSLTGTQTEELVRSVVGNKRPSRPRRKDKTLSFPLEGGRTWRVLVKPKTTYAELEQDAIQLLEEIRTRRSARVSID